jgi:hypothetical protein
VLKEQTKVCDSMKKEIIEEIKHYNHIRRDRIRDHENRVREKLGNHWSSRVENS